MVRQLEGSNKMGGLPSIVVIFMRFIVGLNAQIGQEVNGGSKETEVDNPIPVRYNSLLWARISKYHMHHKQNLFFLFFSFFLFFLNQCCVILFAYKCIFWL